MHRAARSALCACALAVAVPPAIAHAQDDLNERPILLATIQAGPALGLAGGVTFGPALSFGLRMELRRWAPYIEADGMLGLVNPIGSFRVGGEAGLHHVLFAERQSPYFGGGVALSYQQAGVGYWTGGPEPVYGGGGFEVRLSGGYEWLRHRHDSRLFVQSELMLPAYLLKQSDPAERGLYAPAFIISVGGAYLPRR